MVHLDPCPVHVFDPRLVPSSSQRGRRFGSRLVVNYSVFIASNGILMRGLCCFILPLHISPKCLEAKRPAGHKLQSSSDVLVSDGLVFIFHPVFYPTIKYARVVIIEKGQCVR